MTSSGSDETEGSAQAREREVRELAQQAEEEAEQLERRSQQLHEELGAVQEDWRRKRADSSVPGAPPPDDESRPETDRSPGPEAPPEDAG